MKEILVNERMNVNERRRKMGKQNKTAAKQRNLFLGVLGDGLRRGLRVRLRLRAPPQRVHHHRHHVLVHAQHSGNQYVIPLYFS